MTSRVIWILHTLVKCVLSPESLLSGEPRRHSRPDQASLGQDESCRRSYERVGKKAAQAHLAHRYPWRSVALDASTFATAWTLEVTKVRTTNNVGPEDAERLETAMRIVTYAHKALKTVPSGAERARHGRSGPSIPPQGRRGTVGGGHPSSSNPPNRPTRSSSRRGHARGSRCSTGKAPSRHIER